MRNNVRKWWPASDSASNPVIVWICRFAGYNMIKITGLDKLIRDLDQAKEDFPPSMVS